MTGQYIIAIYNSNSLSRGSGILNTDWIQGSIKFVEDSVIPKEKIYFGILLDMVGSGDAVFKYESFSFQRYSNIYKYVWNIARSFGYGSHFSDSHWGFIIDDHSPFVYNGIPFIDIIDMGYKYHHTQGDTLDKMDKKMLGAIGSIVEYVVENPPMLR